MTVGLAQAVQGAPGARPAFSPVRVGRVLWSLAVWGFAVWMGWALVRGIRDPERELAYTIPPGTLLRKMLEHHEPSRLTVYLSGTAVGHCSFDPRPAGRERRASAPDRRLLRITLELYSRAIGTSDHVRAGSTLSYDESRRLQGAAGELSVGAGWFTWDYLGPLELWLFRWGLRAEQLGNFEFRVGEEGRLNELPAQAAVLREVGVLSKLLAAPGDWADLRVRVAEASLTVVDSPLRCYLLLIEDPQASAPFLRIWVGRTGEVLRVATAFGIEMENTSITAFERTTRQFRESEP